MEMNKTKAPVVQTLGYNFMPAPFIDESEKDIRYIGLAPLGINESEKGWQITKEIKENGVTKNLYPSGSMDFNFSWEDRKKYMYSR